MVGKQVRARLVCHTYRSGRTGFPKSLCRDSQQTIPEFCDLQMQRWSFEVTVYKTKTCRGFVGYGDADPTNVSHSPAARKCA